LTTLRWGARIENSNAHTLMYPLLGRRASLDANELIKLRFMIATQVLKLHLGSGAGPSGFGYSGLGLRGGSYSGGGSFM
jgi:hypothetical protein